MNHIKNFKLDGEKHYPKEPKIIMKAKITQHDLLSENSESFNQSQKRFHDRNMQPHVKN